MHVPVKAPVRHSSVQRPTAANSTKGVGWCRALVTRKAEQGAAARIIALTAAEPIPQEAPFSKLLAKLHTCKLCVAKCLTRTSREAAPRIVTCCNAGSW